MRPLSRRFYQRDTVSVARDLVGKRLVRIVNGVTLCGMITETEAYGHANDPASHAYRGMTKRNAPMFGEQGCAYVYFTYGMHYCVNVVARDAGAPAGAVLIRAMVPVRGTRQMIRNRDKKAGVADGPAKLAQAMKITKELQGHDLTRVSELFIAECAGTAPFSASRRIGISKGQEMCWNFEMS